MGAGAIQLNLDPPRLVATPRRGFLGEDLAPLCEGVEGGGGVGVGVTAHRSGGVDVGKVGGGGQMRNVPESSCAGR